MLRYVIMNVREEESTVNVQRTNCQMRIMMGLKYKRRRRQKNIDSAKTSGPLSRICRQNQNGAEALNSPNPKIKNHINSYLIIY